MQDKIIVIVTPELQYVLDESDLMPLGDVVFFGGSRMHILQEVVIDE